MKVILYIHGRGGAAEESAHYAPLFPGCGVIGLDYRGETPWEAGGEIRAAAEKLKKEYGEVWLIANSVGAFFCIYGGLDSLISRAWFISPLADMERWILGAMRRFGITEKALLERGNITVASGETLSWEYLSRVRERPVRWRVPTEILYGSRDATVPLEDVRAFAEYCGAGLTVMENGGHWFHTEAQMRFLDGWIRRTREKRARTLRTERLVLRELRECDGPALTAMMKDGRVNATYMASPLPDRAAEDALFGRLKALSEAQDRFMYAVCLQDECIGLIHDCGLDGAAAEVGYFISPAHWGRGYAAEALGALIAELFRMGYERVSAGYFEGNAASRRVMEKCGMHAVPRETEETYRGKTFRCRYCEIENPAAEN